MGRATVVVVAGLALGCSGPREPGPHEDEFGKVVFWEVSSVMLADEGCTDDPAFQEALALPPLEDNTFFMYEVADDGQSAVAQACEALAADSCEPVDEITFVVEGHQLSWASQPELVGRSPTCEVFAQQTWSFVDQGSEATLDILIDFPFEGTSNGCDELDEELAEQGTNGLGLATCAVSLAAELTFTFAD